MLKSLEQERNFVERVINKREAKKGQIGSGEIKLGSSPENTLKVGEVRRRTDLSITSYRERLIRLNKEIDFLRQATEYLELINLRKIQLAVNGLQLLKLGP